MSSETGSNRSREEAENKWNTRPQETKLELEITAHGYALSALKREIGLGLDPESEDYREIAVKVGFLKKRLHDEELNYHARS